MIRKQSIEARLAAGPAALGLVFLLSMSAAAQEPAAVVEMTPDGFIEQEVTISAGETVEWRNTSSVVHTATADPDLAADPANVELPEGAEPFDSGEVEPGESWSYTFEQPGTYRYICQPHEDNGMLGTVIVE